MNKPEPTPDDAEALALWNQELDALESLIRDLRKGGPDGRSAMVRMNVRWSKNSVARLAEILGMRP